MEDHQQQLRDQLVTLLKGGNAFIPLTKVLDSTPYEITGRQPDNVPFTIWELTEHLRLALHDLVEYSKDSHFHSPPWPDGYWPDTSSPDSPQEWEASINHFRQLLNEMIDRVSDPSNDLYQRFEANADHHLLRQATIAGEHNAYHNGQIVLIRKMLGEW